jgi:Tat protein translocase TatB subunit
MFGIGTPELIVILVVALIVLGPKRLPEVARMLGKSLGELRRATSGFTEELNNARVILEEETRAAVRPPVPKPPVAPGPPTAPGAAAPGPEGPAPAASGPEATTSTHAAPATGPTGQPPPERS